MLNKSNLDNYILLNKIGSGLFGKVYRVKEKQTKIIYAAKISKTALEEETYKLFQIISREVNIISKLKHPSVLKFILYSPINFKHKRKPVIITEYAINGTLSNILEHDRNFPKDRILDDTHKLIIMYGIASGISYLHHHNILHRDLKPENILIDDFLHPKIGDFGLSKSDCQINESVLTKTADGEIKGTLAYMSPEIWFHGEYSKSSDVYAFGFVAYELITNMNPYQNFDFFKLFSAIKKCERPEINIEIPEIYRSLIERCWSQKSSDRPTFDQLLNELRTNHEYILETVDENEYFNYIKYIDEYKTSFDSCSVIIPPTNLKKYQLSLSVYYFQIRNENSSIPIIERFQSTAKHFPYRYLCQLGHESKLLVNKAALGQAESQFKVGQYLIEGRNDFPNDTKKGIDYLKESINNGNTDSLIYYIDMLIKGKLIPSNHLKVRKLLETRLKSKDEGAYYLMYGKLFKNEKNYSLSKEYFERSLKTGNIESYYEYGELIRKGYIESIIQGEIDKCYMKAINEGSLKAMFKYGLYLKSNSNEIKGSQWIKLSADKGYSKALYYMGTLVEIDKSNEDDNVVFHDDESIQYFKRAAYEGHTESMNKYGCKLLKLLQRSPNVENKDEVIRFLKKASDKGCLESMNEYGKLITEENSGAHYNPKEGARFVKIAAENGYANAMASYARLLKYGKGVAVNINEAVRYYKMGIENGSVQAMNDYGYMLKHGQGVGVNYEEAIKYYKMAIDNGYSVAMNNYARMLQNGDGIKVDYQEAIKFYKMAIDKGNPTAMNNYAHMLKSGQGVEINYQEAVKYFKMAIDVGNPIAMNNYAHMLQKGIGAEANYHEAIK